MPTARNSLSSFSTVLNIFSYYQVATPLGEIGLGPTACVYTWAYCLRVYLAYCLRVYLLFRACCLSIAVHETGDISPLMIVCWPVKHLILGLEILRWAGGKKSHP
jgi:hypothetical protein